MGSLFGNDGMVVENETLMILLKMSAPLMMMKKTCLLVDLYSSYSNWLVENCFVQFLQFLLLQVVLGGDYDECLRHFDHWYWQMEESFDVVGLDPRSCFQEELHSPKSWGEPEMPIAYT